MGRATLMLLFSLALLVEPAPRGSHPPVNADGSGCATCHAPVTSHRVMHGPAGLGACQTCHVAVDTGGTRRIALARGARPGNTKPLCVSCHQEVGTRLASAHVHAPVAGGDCSSCHDPHGSAFRFQLPADGNRACLTCHEDIAQVVEEKFPHRPAIASCTMCHDPHASKFPSQLRAVANEVCVACHASNGAAHDSKAAVALFGAAAAATHAALVKAGTRIALDPSGDSGHPTLRHPVAGTLDPTRPGKPLGCTSCHNPHGAKSASLLRFDATGTSALCIQCHKY
jgi:predicted CXXCH cytochrome family protein